jgi:hypothetical protein
LFLVIPFCSVPDPSDFLRRIRILGSVHWITDPDPDPALFDSGFKDAHKKYLFLLITFCRYVYKKVEIKVFLNFFRSLMEGSESESRSGSVQIITFRVRILELQKLPDPHPEHLSAIKEID